MTRPTTARCGNLHHEADRRPFHQRLLGVQVAGPGAVDKIVDITVTAIQCGATLDQLDGADFAYAPPFSTAIHPFAHTLNVLKNKLTGPLRPLPQRSLPKAWQMDYRIVDASLSLPSRGRPMWI